MSDELVVCPKARCNKFRQSEGCLPARPHIRCLHACPHIRCYSCTEEYIVWVEVDCPPCEKFFGVVIKKERSLEGESDA